jgi:outer membrane protein
MNRLLLVLATLLASGFVLGAAAQTPAAPAAAPAGSTRIAVIAFQMAVGQTNEGQRNFADLKKKYQPRESGLQARSDEIESLTKQLQAKGSTLSETARAAQARTIDEKKKKLDRDAGDLRTEGQQEANEMYNNLASKVYDVMAGYAQEQGFSVVLDVSQQQNPILFALPSTDITKPVVEAYNVKSGVPPPPPQPPAAPSPQARPQPPAAH